jgi:hypothetical protein
VTFPIVAIGASAGGLEAVLELLAAVPSKSGMAYIVVQHLDPINTTVSIRASSSRLVDPWICWPGAARHTVGHARQCRTRPRCPLRRTRFRAMRTGCCWRACPGEPPRRLLIVDDNADSALINGAARAFVGTCGRHVARWTRRTSDGRRLSARHRARGYPDAGDGWV